MEINNIEFDDKFLVLKTNDISNRLSKEQKRSLVDIITTIDNKRRDEGKGINDYLVINTDESYSSEIAEIMRKNGHCKSIKTEDSSCKKEYKYWDVKKVNKTEDGDVISVELVDADYENKKLSFKWDGCVDYWEYSNGYTVNDEFSEDKAENTDYIHICDLIRHIEAMQEVVEIARESLGEERFIRDWV